MKGWVKAAVVIVVVLIIAASGYYLINRGKSDSEQITDDDGSPLVKVNATAVSIYLGKLAPTPAISSITFRVYAPGQGHVDRMLSLSSERGLFTTSELYPGVDLEYRDLNNDSAAGNGDFFTIRSEGEHLYTGIWHAELIYGGHVSGNVSFHFHILPPGITSIAENAEVDFIDVGQGDAELIHTSDGKHILIDAGPNGAESSLLQFLGGKGVTTLDAMIMTHPDADHIGGAEEVLETLEVKSVYHPGLVKNTSTFWGFISAAKMEGCPIYTDSQIKAGDYLNLSVSEDLRVLSINASAESNEASIVLRMDASSKSFLFTGDIGFEVENELLANFHDSLDVDVLKVAHHGSRTSSSMEFLEAVTPSVAVIEVGTNTYGHPTGETLSRLATVGASIIRTDQAGTNVVSSNGGAVQ